MNRKNSFIAYTLIGLGFYFLLKQLNIPLFSSFYAWPTIVIIIGVALLLHSYSAREYESLFSGTIILGIGIHFHGLHNYPRWIDHWAVYLLIIGVALLVRSLKTKTHFLSGIICTSISLFLILPVKIPQFNWIHSYDLIWPLIIIFIGFYLLRQK